MEKRSSILMLLVCLLLIGVESYAQNTRQSYTINSNWAFHKGSLNMPIQAAYVTWDTEQRLDIRELNLLQPYVWRPCYWCNCFV